MGNRKSNARPNADAASYRVKYTIRRHPQLVFSQKGQDGKTALTIGVEKWCWRCYHFSTCSRLLAFLLLAYKMEILDGSGHDASCSHARGLALLSVISSLFFSHSPLTVPHVGGILIEVRRGDARHHLIKKGGSCQDCRLFLLFDWVSHPPSSIIGLVGGRRVALLPRRFDYRKVCIYKSSSPRNVGTSAEISTPRIVDNLWSTFSYVRLTTASGLSALPRTFEKA